MDWRIIAAFIAGELAGLLVAAIVSGRVDKIRKWRKRRNEQKSLRNHFSHRGSGDHA